MAIVREIFTDRERAVIEEAFSLPQSAVRKDLTCSACGGVNYDSDYARCAGCRRVDTFGFKLTHITWRGDRTSHYPAKTYHRVPSTKRNQPAPTSVRVVGNVNASVPKLTAVPQITEEGQAVTASESNWLSRFKATRTLNSR